jgi:hypothetical protein
LSGSNRDQIPPEIEYVAASIMIVQDGWWLIPSGVISAYQGGWPILSAVISIYLLRKLVIFARLRHFKGPRSTGFSNFLHSRALLGKECHLWYEEVSAKYG